MIPCPYFQNTSGIQSILTSPNNHSGLSHHVLPGLFQWPATGFPLLPFQYLFPQQADPSTIRLVTSLPCSKLPWHVPPLLAQPLSCSGPGGVTWLVSTPSWPRPHYFLYSIHSHYSLLWHKPSPTSKPIHAILRPPPKCHILRNVLPETLFSFCSFPSSIFLQSFYSLILTVWNFLG